jgi:hypothetical protein
VATPASSLPQGADALCCGPGRLVSRSPAGTPPRRSQGSPRFLGGPPCVHALGCYPGGSPTPSHPAPEMLPSAHPTTSAPRCSLSRLITTACTLAVYASWSGLLLPPRKTRFRWVASPCRVGFGPTGSTAKGFGFCLLHIPSSLPRLRLAQGASLRTVVARAVRYAVRGNPFRPPSTPMDRHDIGHGPLGRRGTNGSPHPSHQPCQGRCFSPLAGRARRLGGWRDPRTLALG